jgi:hypothetical protein
MDCNELCQVARAAEVATSLALKLAQAVRQLARFL